MSKDIIKGKTTSGFEYTIPKENLDNYELIEALSEIEENPLVIAKIVDMLLGKDQTKNLKEHVRSKTGIVSSEKMGEEIKNIFESVNETKNS